MRDETDLSGLKLTLPRGEEPSLTAYYLGRVKRLLLPYLLAAAVYYLYFVRIGWYSFSPAQFLRETALGTLSAQFYFLVALMQFILLAPLFRRLARRYAPVLLLPLALGITWLSSMYFNTVLQLAIPDAAFPYGDRIFTSYLVYYLAGCCAGQHYPRVLALLEENRPLLTASALFFGGADGVISGLAFSGRRSAPYLELIHTLYILSAILVLLGWARRHTALMSGSRGPLLRATDRASYLIYLYHCLAITLFDAAASRLVVAREGPLLLLRLLIVLSAAIGGSVLWQKLRARFVPARK